MPLVQEHRQNRTAMTEPVRRILIRRVLDGLGMIALFLTTNVGNITRIASLMTFTLLSSIRMWMFLKLFCYFCMLPIAIAHTLNT